MNTGKLASTFKEHQVLVLATLAGTVGVWFAVFRKSPTPIVNVTSPVAASAGYSSADTLAAVGAGSAASLAGFQPGIDLAGRALDNATALAQTQELALQTISGLFTPIPVPIAQPGPGPVNPIQPPPAPSPPIATPTPVYNGALHTATVTGATGNAYTPGNPSTENFLGNGTSVQVLQLNLDGTIWWVVEGGPYAGFLIRYHDSNWSVAP